MQEVERRWLDYAWRVVTCPPAHVAECELAGGAVPHPNRPDGNDLRWPGYLGRAYEPSRGILCMAHAHREPTTTMERDHPVIERTNRKAIAAARRWIASGRREAEADAEFLETMRSVYEEALPAWNRWEAFVEIIDGLGLDLTQVAYGNLAKCRVPIERDANPFARLCQRQFPVIELVAALRPVGVLTCVLQAGRDGSLVNSWDTPDAHPLVVSWHGRNGTDSRGRRARDWRPEAITALRARLSGGAAPKEAPKKVEAAARAVPVRRVARAKAPRPRATYPPADPDVLERTRHLMGTDKVRPAQAQNYEQLLQAGEPMLELLQRFGADNCRAVARMTLLAPAAVRDEGNELMSALPKSHIWFRGICAYAVAAGHVR